MLKRLLVVSYAFPPLCVAEAEQTARTVHQLATLGWEMTVLTIQPRSTTERYAADRSPAMPDSVKIVRAASPERFLFGWIKNRTAERFARHGLQFLGLPEKQFLWFPKAVQAGIAILAAEQFTAIYSRACYHTGNVVGLALHRATGLPFVAHFSDPWIDNPYHKLWPLQKLACMRLEHSIISKAAVIIFVTQQAAERVMARYPARWRSKVAVIPHGYDPQEPIAPALIRNPVDRLRVVYTGSFYSLRTPMNLLLALRELARVERLQGILEVFLIGPGALEYRSTVRKFGLDGVVRLQGPQTRLECLRATAGADVLLLLGSSAKDEGLFLPSKLVDYIALRKPILGLTPLEGASADLLRRLQCPVVPPDNIAAVADNIATTIHRWRAGVLTVGHDFETVARDYSIRATTAKLESFLTKAALREAPADSRL
jgi:hypothetical protein